MDEQRCAVCERPDVTEHYIIACHSCCRKYCHECHTFNLESWNLGSYGKVYLKNGEAVEVSAYARCIGCAREAAAPELDSVKKMFHNRVGVAPGKCFRCRHDGGQWGTLSRCLGCRRNWCEKCTSMCIDANIIARVIKIYMVVEMEYYEIKSCPMCPIANAMETISSAADPLASSASNTAITSNTATADDIAFSLACKLEQTDLRELFEIAGEDYDAFLEAAKMKLVNGA